MTLSNALLPGVRTWKVNAEHGKLPDVASAFSAYIELLQTGHTTQLESRDGPARNAGSADSRDENDAITISETRINDLRIVGARRVVFDY